MANSNPVRKLTLGLALWAARSPWLAVGVVALLTLAFCAGLRTLRVDASNNAMFGSHDQAQVDYQAFQKEFGREDAVVLAIRSDAIFRGEFMDRLRGIHKALESSVPWVAEVSSLANVTYVDEADGVVRTSKLGDRWPAQGELSAELRQDLLQSPLYRRTLLSPDGQMTLLVVRPQTFVTQAALDAQRQARQEAGNVFQRLGQAVREWHDRLDERLGVKAPAAPASAVGTGMRADDAVDAAQDIRFDDGSELSALQPASLRLPSVELAHFNAAIRAVAEQHRASGVQIHVSGGPVIDEAHEESVHRDAGLMTGISLLVVVFALAIQLRSFVGVALPVAVVGVSLAATLGMMGWVDFPITAVSQALPPILLTMGVLSSVHLLTHFLQNPEPDFETAVREMFEHSGDPVVYTVLTDVLAFLAFTIARLEPISEFGWMAAFGSMVGLLYTILLLPALLRLGRVRHGAATQRRDFFDKLTQLVTPVGMFCSRHYRAVLAAVVAVILLMLPGIARINYAHDVLTWFEPGHVLREDTLAIDARMQATVPLEVVIDTGKEDGILTPQFMAGLRALQDYCGSLSNGALQVGSATSIVDSIERVHHVLTGGTDGALPRTEALLHQELVLYEGGGAKELQRLTDRRYSKARVTVRMAWTDAHAYVGMDEKILRKARELFGNEAKVTITGVAYLQSVGALDVIDSMWSSYLLSAGLIAAMLFIVLRELRISLASIVPNFLPVWISLGVMGYLALPVDMFMVLLGGIALAVSVDDTVHFMHTVLRHKRKEGVHITEAVRATLGEVGAALVIASIVMACGFYTFAFSSIVPLARFGLILGSTLLLALVLDLIVSPALVTAIAMLEAGKPDAKATLGEVR